MKVRKESIGQVDNQPVFSYTLTNDHGMEVTVLNYGCIITKILVPDKNGNVENIVLGYDTLNEYVEDPYFLGAVVGRVGGRIKGGTFELDGKTYSLAQNDGNNHLHGGIKGFNKVVWYAVTTEDAVRFAYLSKDGDEGYPGNLRVEVTYTLTNENELQIAYQAQTDAKTLVTVTNHSYFNLTGNAKRDVLNHTLTLKSDRFLELADDFIPTGEQVEVAGTPFDFRNEAPVKTGVTSDYPQNVLVGNGYDHPFVLNTNHDNEIVLQDGESGRRLTVETDEPAVIVYSGNSLEPKKHLGICLETQAFPDAIHHSQFPSIILEKGEQYSSVTKYKFGLI